MSAYWVSELPLRDTWRWGTLGRLSPVSTRLRMPRQARMAVLAGRTDRTRWSYGSNAIMIALLKMRRVTIPQMRISTSCTMPGAVLRVLLRSRRRTSPVPTCQDRIRNIPLMRNPTSAKRWTATSAVLPYKPTRSPKDGIMRRKHTPIGHGLLCRFIT